MSPDGHIVQRDTLASHCKIKIHIAPIGLFVIHTFFARSLLEYFLRGFICYFLLNAILTRRQLELETERASISELELFSF